MKISLSKYHHRKKQRTKSKIIEDKFDTFIPSNENILPSINIQFIQKQPPSIDIAHPPSIDIPSNQEKKTSTDISNPLSIDIPSNQEHPPSTDTPLQKHYRHTFQSKQESSTDISQPPSIDIPSNQERPSSTNTPQSPSTDIPSNQEKNLVLTYFN